MDAMGPVSYLIVEFPGGRMTGEVLPMLVDLVDRGLIRILDFKFMAREADGRVRTVELADLGREGTFDFRIFEGISSGLIDQSDLADAASVIEPGSTAAVLIYENRGAAPLAEKLRGGGAEMVAAGFIPLEDLLASLDAIETTNV